MEDEDIHMCSLLVDIMFIFGIERPGWRSVIAKFPRGGRAAAASKTVESKQ